MITYEKVTVCLGNFWDGGCEGGREDADFRRKRQINNFWIKHPKNLRSSASQKGLEFLLLIRQFHGLAAADQHAFAGNQHLHFGPADFTNINLPRLIRHLHSLLNF
jgi:hypothetical protein